MQREIKSSFLNFKFQTLHGRLPANSMKYDTSSCTELETGMFSSSSSLDSVNCSRLKLVGLNEISCSVDYTQPNIGEFSKKIYFLCPGQYSYLKLTITFHRDCVTSKFEVQGLNYEKKAQETYFNQ